MKTFKDLVFKEHSVAKGAKEACKRGIDMQEYTKAKQAIIKFDNAKSVSVLFGSVFYSNGIDTYEAWCQEIDREPRGYLTKEQVTEYMIEVQKL